MDFKRVLLIAISSLGVILLVLSLFVFYGAFSMSADRLVPVKDCFDLTVSKVLLPMFTTTVTSALAYVFGKPIVAALSERLGGRPRGESAPK